MRVIVGQKRLMIKVGTWEKEEGEKGLAPTPTIDDLFLLPSLCSYSLILL